jgi:hypothetical protein
MWMSTAATALRMLPPLLPPSFASAPGVSTPFTVRKNARYAIDLYLFFSAWTREPRRSYSALFDVALRSSHVSLAALAVSDHVCIVTAYSYICICAFLLCCMRVAGGALEAASQARVPCAPRRGRPPQQRRGCCLWRCSSGRLRLSCWARRERSFWSFPERDCEGVGCALQR